MCKEMITVFTPTYNRAKTLLRLYHSLLEQTCQDFEWIVVDDGSTDDTEVFFQKLLQDHSSFPIRYIRQSNGGKHRAINRGVQLAQGELFFIVDSDDFLLPHAIERLFSWRTQLPKDVKYAGVSGLRGYSATKRIGQSPKNKLGYMDATNLERDKYRLGGDKAEAYFTEVLLQYPFPEFKNENFLTEEVVWNRIAYEGYLIRWVDEIIYICEYMENGLTKSGFIKYQTNIQGTLYWAQGQLCFFKKNIKRRAITVMRYYQCVKDKKRIKEIAKDLQISVVECGFLLSIGTFYNILKKGRKG